jgi:hypothetical protein
MEKQMTAVEFLIDNLHYSTSTKWKEIIEKAKEIEKEQIIDGYKKFLNTTLSDEVYEQYYNENFKNK